MLKDSLIRFFPTPRFLSLPSYGLDISDESLKFVQLIPTKNGLKLGRYGDRKIPLGIIESGRIKDPKKLEDILSLLRSEEGLKSVRVSLPEEQIYLYKLQLDKAGLVHVREAIELSLEEHIPIPAQEAIFDYEILHEDAKTLYLEVEAIPKTIIEEYLSVFTNARITVQSFELEAHAISRAVVGRGDLDTYMIMDFGEKRTGIFIVSKGLVMFTSTLDMGGYMLTSMIQKSFNASFDEAEQMKRTYGLQRNIGNKELFAVLLNSVSVLRDEVARHFLYWHTHKDDEGHNNPPIKSIILCGGDSNLIGLSDYFSVSMKSRVEMANVWTNMMHISKEVPDIKFERALSFAAAIGLALGDFEYD